MTWKKNLNPGFFMQSVRWCMGLTYIGGCSLLFYQTYFYINIKKVHFPSPCTTQIACIDHQIIQNALQNKKITTKAIYDTITRASPLVSTVRANWYANQVVDIYLTFIEPIVCINNTMVLCNTQLIDHTYFTQATLDSLPAVTISNECISSTAFLSTLSNVISTIALSILENYDITIRHETSFLYASRKHKGLVIESTAQNIPTVGDCTRYEKIFNSLKSNGFFEKLCLTLLFDTRFSECLIVSQDKGRQWQALNQGSKSPL